ncbi:outer membrane receptor protein involved in Fe transport [Novosphingobium sp. 1748]|uniref:TonB-dependent receptor n=1 Tax=Novosphingobium sp. 1748 TaxID=2817760 RepID=UPI002861B3E4|nr:TonB-dependent receptor [Novosphingobium sp. 1748]MDR6709303.1 outer membrane receptor protein involved in Fe transport [Novosphingobium sp. 1748]
MAKVRKYILSSAIALTAIAVISPTAAGPDDRQEYHLPEQELSAALRIIGRASHQEIMFEKKSVEGKRAPALNGTYSAAEAVEILLRNSGLAATSRDGSILIGERFLPSSEEVNTASSAIVVTGSQIRGTGNTGPLITISSKQIEASGYSNLGDVVRSIPQNFSGGQNPGIGIGIPVANGENFGSGSSINLRGLGQDATLTLINGHRVSNGGNRQSVDVSAIPIDAIERIEIVTDGASALYGSDAVAGVANVILKRDYQGLSTSARFGLATEGGDRQQQYNIVTGKRWRNGGGVIAYEYGKDTAILASQRSYAAVTNPGLTLYPFIQHQSAIINLHQDITKELKFNIDGGYNWRTDQRGYSLTTAANSPAYDSRVRSSSFFAAPSLQWSPLAGWLVSLSGMYGQDHARLLQQLTSNGATSTTQRTCTCNSAVSVELKADGPLLEIPGGTAKLAVGGGYRRDWFRQESMYASSNFSAGQAERYGFAELHLPLVGKSQNIPFIHSLALSAAARYDNYPGVDEVVTPKVAFSYAPTHDFDIRGSWGQSFKVPTLYQRYTAQSASIYATGTLGGSGYPAGSTAIFLLGGRPDLSPERAETWTTSLAFHPARVRGLKIELGYFDIRYRNRVIMPISLPQQSLSNPAYGSIVTYNPATFAVTNALADKVIYNYSGAAYNPANVVAIVDDRNLNIATQKLRGIDLAAEYQHTMANGDRIILSASGSYLESEQKLLPKADTIILSGTYYNPPHFRSRVGMSWDSARLSLSGFVNYIGGLSDTRYTPATPVSGMATLDLTGRLRLAGGALDGVEFFFAAQNITNASPDITRTRAAYDAPYDTTNYSPVGRLISLGIRKNW